jgi:nitrite reductase (NADH) large subunit
MKTHIIIGTSAAALGVLNKLRALDPASTIICISDESEIPYNKCFLADYLGGTKKEHEVTTKPLHFFEQQQIKLLLGKRVIDLDAQQKKITLNDGQSLSYDSLFLGTGSSPVIPPAFNKKLPGLFTFHTLADSNAILNYAHEHKVQQAVVVGTGLSGLECADALTTRGVKVTVISRHEQVLRRFINQEASSLIESMMTSKGITLLKNSEPKELLADETTVHGLRLNDGREIKAALVIVATGLRPNNELAHAARLQLQDGYLVVNEYMQTSDDAIWAGGDCCMVRDQMSGNLVPSATWPDAMMQGMIAAYAMSGQQKKYPGITAVVSSSFFGTQFVTAGSVLTPLPHHRIKVQSGPDFYHATVFDGERLQGFLLVGQVNQAPRLKRALLTGQPV